MFQFIKGSFEIPENAEIMVTSLQILCFVLYFILNLCLLFLIQTIVPDAKPLSAEEVRLGSPNFQPSAKSSSNQENEEEETTHSSTKSDKVESVRRVAVEVAEAVTSAKPEVVLAAAAPLLEATSPAQQPRACVLHVSNLVRPFTIPQLKELLARTGHLIDGKFWIDKVKSSCLIQVSSTTLI